MILISYATRDAPVCAAKRDSTSIIAAIDIVDSWLAAGDAADGSSEGCGHASAPSPALTGPALDSDPPQLM